jgi:uncharacterized protein YecT (DUF1311 family)
MRWSCTSLFLVVTVTWLPVPAMAECAMDGNQSEMTGCAAARFEQADTELNRIWSSIIEKAKLIDSQLSDGRPGYVETLRKGQRAWIDYRDSQCDLQGFDVRGGSMEPMVVLLCREQMTLDRIKELQEPNGTSGEPRW